MKYLIQILIILNLLAVSVFAQDENKEEKPQTQPQTQTKPSVIIMPEDKIEELLKKLDELEKLKRGQRYFKVLAVDSSEQGLVLLNGGWGDGLKVGFRLQIFRRNHNVTTIELLEVLEEESIGKVLSEKNAGLIKKGDFAKLLPYIPPKKIERVTPDKVDSKDPDKKDNPKDDSNETKHPKFPFEMRELEDLLSETLIEKEKFENENKAYIDELYVLRQDVKALELELQRDESKSTIYEKQFNELLRQYQILNHLGVFASFEVASGTPMINGFMVGKNEFFYQYSAGVDFYSFEGLTLSAQYSVLEQPSLEHNKIAGIFSLEMTFYDHFTIGYRSLNLYDVMYFPFFDTTFDASNSQELILRAQSLPYFNSIPEKLNVLEINEIHLNYGLEIAKDFENGTGTDYRVFMGLNNFFLVQLNFNHSYWTDSAKFGMMYTELRGAIPVFQNIVEIWLMAKISYQIALNDKVYEDLGTIRLSCLIYF